MCCKSVHVHCSQCIKNQRNNIKSVRTFGLVVRGGGEEGPPKVPTPVPITIKKKIKKNKKVSAKHILQYTVLLLRSRKYRMGCEHF